MNDQSRTYRVVRLQTEPGLGSVEEILGEHLSLEEAERLADSESPSVAEERLLIEDESKRGIEALVRMDALKTED